MALTDTAIKNAKPLSKQYRLTDGLGLYLLVRPNGSKLWRQDYRFASKDKTLSVGIYPDVSLKLARERRDEIRSLVAQGIDPSLQCKTSKLVQSQDYTFEAIAREWFTKQATAWAKSHSSKIIRRLERDIFPWLGASPITSITAPELLAVLRKIETRGKHETAHRALQNCSQIFRYLKGKSSLIIFDKHANLKYKFGNRKFCSEGYFVSTVGINQATIRKYIQEQEKQNLMQDKRSVREHTSPFKG